jgi:type II secretory pathway component PulK
MRNPHRSDRGLAMITAIMLISLAGIAMTVMGVAFNMQATRTHLQAEQAQIRQLLLAGAEETRERLEQGKPVDGSITLPAYLAENGASLKLNSEGPTNGASTIEIEASLPGCRSTQEVKFAGTGSHWHLVSAELAR